MKKAAHGSIRIGDAAGQRGGAAVMLLLFLFTFNTIFLGMLYFTGTIDMDEVKVAFGMKPSDVEIIASMQHASSSDRELVIEAERIAREKEELENKRKEVLFLQRQISIDKESMREMREVIDGLRLQYTEALEEAREKDLFKIVTILNMMKPQEIARILRGYDEESMIDILVRIDERKAAKILALMDSDTAVRISNEMGQYGKKVDPVR
jgi:flagellar motility protein MotE (MotC chaperone)